MELVPGDRKIGLQTPVWKSYESILLEAGCVVRLLPHPGGSRGPSAPLWRLVGVTDRAPKPPYSCGSCAHPPQKSDPGGVAVPTPQPLTSQVRDPVMAWGASPTPACVSGARGK